MGGGAVKLLDTVEAILGFVIRLGLSSYVMWQIDFVNGRPYEQAMAFGMIYLLMTQDKGGKA